MMQEGAGILDVGGASSRPGAAPVSIAEEIDRIAPVIEGLSAALPGVWISADTCHPEVAIAAVGAGAHMINDINAGQNDEMLATVAKLRVPYVAMHMQGSPATMQDSPSYTDVVADVFAHLKAVVLRCRHYGIHDVLPDPGFGFGKSVAHNYALLNELAVFRALGRPLLVGLSRKSMICKPLALAPKDALNGTTALHMAALREGATVLRAHDVREAVETIRLFELIG